MSEFYEVFSKLCSLRASLSRDTARQSEGCGFSLIEMMIVISLLGILSAVAIGQYKKYKNAGFKAAMKMELTQMAKYLNNAHSVDGAYHQKIFTAGYRPNYTLYTDAGFHYNSTDPLCCSNYQSPYQQYFTLSSQVLNGGSADSAVRAGELCAHGFCKTNTRNRYADITRPSPVYSNSSGDSACNDFTSASADPDLAGKAECRCNKYIVMAVTRIAKNHTALSRMFLNQKGLMCDEGSGRWEAGDDPLKRVK